jgi:hypothetical protein
VLTRRGPLLVTTSFRESVLVSGFGHADNWCMSTKHLSLSDPSARRARFDSFL